MRLFSTLAILILFTSFTPAFALSRQGKAEIVFKSYQDYPVSHLLEAFGEPVKITKERNGNKIYLYGSSYEDYEPIRTETNETTDDCGNTTIETIETGGYFYERFFWLSFIVDKHNIVRDWNWDGNDQYRYFRKFSRRDYVNPDYVLDLAQDSVYDYGLSFKEHRKGLKLTNVVPNSPAHIQGLRQGRIIHSVNGRSIRDLPLEIKQKIISDSGNKVRLGFKLKGKLTDVHLKKTHIPALEYLSNSEKKYLGFRPGFWETLFGA